MARASRHQARSAQRAQPNARSDARATPLPWLIAAAAILALITVVIFQTASSSHANNHNTTKTGLSTIQYKEDQEVEAILQGIPQHGITLGAPTAPYTLQFYGDLQDFTSKIFAVSFLPSIIYELVRKNQLKIEYHGLQTDTHDPQTFARQQEAALAAGQQDKLWNFILVFFHQQKQEYTNYVTEEYLYKIAQQIPGLNISQWAHQRENPQLFDQILEDWRTTTPWPHHITPAFFLSHTGNKKIVQLRGYEIKQLPGTLLDALNLDEAIQKLH